MAEFDSHGASLLDEGDFATVNPRDGSGARAVKPDPDELPLPPSQRTPHETPPSSSEVDPRVAAVDQMLTSGDWPALCELLGPPQHAQDLPPMLGLVYATARREVADEASDTDSNLLALRCMAELLGVSTDSVTALQLSKRLLRVVTKVMWREAPAPPTKTSTIIILATLAIGALVGYLLGPGAF